MKRRLEHIFAGLLAALALCLSPCFAGAAPLEDPPAVKTFWYATSGMCIEEFNRYQIKETARGRFVWIELHNDCLLYTSLIHLHARQRYPVKQRIERPQRTQPLAERAVEQQAQDNHRTQHHALPGKQTAQRASDAVAGHGQGNRSLQHALGAQVLAEEGIAQPHLVGEDQRQRDVYKRQSRVHPLRHVR